MYDPLHWESIGRFFGVMGTNLILSGDNAMVIAMAARRLRGPARRKAIFWGASGAVGLRLVFAVVITALLSLPFLRVVGGVLLFWIAWQLVRGEGDEAEDRVKAGSGLWDSVRIIILADAVMSLDNVIALVGVSGGSLWLLGVGLLLTIPLVIWGATLLSSLIDRFPVLAYAGAALLAWIALEMASEDDAVRWLDGALGSFETPTKLVVTAAFVAALWLGARKRSKGAGLS